MIVPLNALPEGGGVAAMLTRADIYRSTIRQLFAPVARLLFEDDDVTEVLINGPYTVYCERNGKLELAEGVRFEDDYALMTAIRNIAEYVRRRVGDDHHSMDARLPAPEQFRVHVIVPPCSKTARRVVGDDGVERLKVEEGPVVSIRKFRRNNTQLAWLVEKGSISPAAVDYLKLVVKNHLNLIVSGGTGSGKTSLLNALSAEIPDHERIIVIEDSSELQLQQAHTVYLEAKQAGPDGRGKVTIRDLFVDSLRMRPDRILVGEVRRGEALDLIQSMLSGHDGALSTVHASSSLLALVRLETLCLMNDVGLPVYVARTQVASALHVIVQIARLPDGTRRVTEIAEVHGLDEKEKYVTRQLFRFERRGHDDRGMILGELVWTGERSHFREQVIHSRDFKKVASSAGIWLDEGSRS